VPCSAPYRTPPMRRASLICILAALIAIAAFVVAPAASAASKPHRYPRTYHLYGGWKNKERLAKYDMLVGPSGYDLSYLRRHDRRGIFLLAPGLRRGPGDKLFVNVTYGAANRWNGGRDRIRGGIKLGYIRPFEERWDYLYNYNGRLARRTGNDGVIGWNLADPTRHGTPSFIAKVVAHAAEVGGINKRGWDGIHSDAWNYVIGTPARYGPDLDTNRDGRADDPKALQRNWCNGLARVGRQLRRYMPGKIVGGNSSWFKPERCSIAADPKAWLKTSNYTMVQEIQQVYYNEPAKFIALARRWLRFPDPRHQRRYFAVTQNAFDCGGNEIRVPSSDDPNAARYMLNRCVMRSMRWGLSLALMTGAYYEVKSEGHAAQWWYDEFDGGVGVRRRGYLGMPTGRVTRIRPGVYLRRFKNGVVVNNSTSSTQTVSLGRVYKHLRGRQNPALNDGSRARSVTVPDHDGVILLKVR
jgi:hypothetical protein